MRIGSPTIKAEQLANERGKNRLDFSWTISSIFLIAALDVTRFVSSGPTLRYAIFIPLLALALFSDMQFRSTPASKIPVSISLSLVLGIWLAAIWSSALFRDSWVAETGVYLIPGLLLIISPLLWSVHRSKTDAISKVRDVAPVISIVTFSAVAVLDVLGTPESKPPFVLSHEKYFLVAFVMLLPSFKFSKMAKLFSASAALLSFVHYPSATVTIMVTISVIYFAVKRLETNPQIKMLIISLTFTIFLILTLNQEFRASFYSSLGRYDNSATRFMLWSQAYEWILESPFWGGAGSLPITAMAYFQGQLAPVPLHNSFLSMAVTAGVIGVLLLVAIMLGIIWRSLKREVSVKYEQSIDYAPIMLIFLLTFTVNPILDTLTGAVGFYSILIMAALSEESTRSQLLTPSAHKR